MNKTSIEWTHRPQTGGVAGGFTWNPIRARLKVTGTLQNGKQVHSGTFCTRISPGCTNCYASVINKRFGTGAEYTVPNLEQHEFYIDEKILAEPLSRKKPATIFVGDMFDLFHEAIPQEMIDAVFHAMGSCRQHVFQVLTKRADRMRRELAGNPFWFTPLANVWLGVSVEDQQRADERIPLLLQTPAALRFLSVEPQLEVVDLRGKDPQGSCIDDYEGDPKVDWVICGGESGPGARPFRTEWAQSIIEQCKSAGVACFVKQLGSNVVQDGESRRKKDRKGGDMHEWPHELRVREFPA